AKTFGGSPLPADFWWPPRLIAAALVLAQSNIVPPKAESNPQQWISAILGLTPGLRRMARQEKFLTFVHLRSKIYKFEFHRCQFYIFEII
ncbi:MAG: hypothetical protein R6X05_03050, partial [Desulfobacterales bacterium]